MTQFWGQRCQSAEGGLTLKNKRIFGGLALALAGTIALAACSSSGSSSSTPSSSSSAASVKSGGTFTYALDQDVAGFNINQATDSEFVLQEIMNQIWPTVFVTSEHHPAAAGHELRDQRHADEHQPADDRLPDQPQGGLVRRLPDRRRRLHLHLAGRRTAPETPTWAQGVRRPAPRYNQIKSITGSNGGKTVTVVFYTPFGDWKSLFSDICPAHIAKTGGQQRLPDLFNGAA